MKYVELINKKICEEISRHEDLVLFGQNISAGSCLGGLTKNIPIQGGRKIINSTNSENSLVGFGFGLMLEGGSSIFFMKQLDFLFLGIDHIVNTYNIIRNTNKGKSSSFTIMPVIIDSGYQGPQSSSNNLADICSMARVSGYVINNIHDAKEIISNHLVSPGFRIIGVSQRLFQKEIIDFGEQVYTGGGGGFFQYTKGRHASIVCFNFSLSQGMELLEAMKNNNFSASLFSVNTCTKINWKSILDDIALTGRLVVMDDSKGSNILLDAFLVDVNAVSGCKKTVIMRRNIDDNWLNPIADEVVFDNEQIISDLWRD